MMTCEEWKREFNSAVIQTEFMGKLSKRYSRHEMAKLWQSLEAMNRRYGSIFVSDAIHKDPSAAELALFRYGKNQKTAEIDCIAVRSRKKVRPC